MATIKQNDITFGNWKPGSGSLSTVIAIDPATVNPNVLKTDIASGEFITKNESAINAVEINWNKASVAGKELETTGQVLGELETIENILINI